MSKAKIINSVFDVLGKNEVGLTRALAICLKQDKSFLLKALQQAFNTKISINKKSFELLEFTFENRTGKKGRTDIEIKNDEIHIIFEAKKGLNLLNDRQIKEYSDYLRESQSKRRIFIKLTENDNFPIKDFPEKYPEIKYGVLNWFQIFNLLRKLRTEMHVNLSNEMKKFLTRGLEMKVFDLDIWAVVVNMGEELSLLSKCYYRNKYGHNPKLIGIREWNKKSRKVVVKKLYPVLEVYSPNSKESVEHSGGADYVYKLGVPLILEVPLNYSFNKKSNSAIHVRFDSL